MAIQQPKVISEERLGQAIGLDKMKENRLKREAQQETALQKFEFNQQKFAELEAKASIYNNKNIDKQIQESRDRIAKWENHNDPDARESIATELSNITALIGKAQGSKARKDEILAYSDSDPFIHGKAVRDRVMAEAYKPFDEQDWDAVYNEVSTDSSYVKTDALVRELIANNQLTLEGGDVRVDEEAGIATTYATKTKRIAGWIRPDGSFEDTDTMIRASTVLLADPDNPKSRMYSNLIDGIREQIESGGEDGIEEALRSQGITDPDFIEDYKLGEADPDDPTRDALALAVAIKGYSLGKVSKQAKPVSTRNLRAQAKYNTKLFTSSAEQNKAKNTVDMIDTSVRDIIAGKSPDSTTLGGMANNKGKRIVYYTVDDKGNKKQVDTLAEAQFIGVKQKRQVEGTPQSKAEDITKGDYEITGIHDLSKGRTVDVIGKSLIKSITNFGVSNFDSRWWDERGNYGFAEGSTSEYDASTLPSFLQDQN